MYQALAYTAGFTPLIPAGMGIFLFRNLSTSYKVLVIYFILSCCSAVTTITLALNQVNNLPWFHLWTLVQFTFLAWYFHTQFSRKSLKLSLVILIPAFAVFAVVNAFFIEGIWNFNSNSSTVESIILVIVALIAFGKLFIQADEGFVDRKPLFWVSAAVLIYFAGKTIVFGVYNHALQTDPELIHEAFAMHSVLLILYNLIFVMVFFKSVKWNCQQ